MVDKRLLKRQEQRKRKLKEVGIDYDFDMVAYVRWCFTIPHFIRRFTCCYRKRNHGRVALKASVFYPVEHRKRRVIIM